MKENVDELLLYRCDGEQRGDIFKKINIILAAKLTLKTDRQQKRERKKKVSILQEALSSFSDVVQV